MSSSATDLASSISGSVVVATYNRVAFAERLLDALGREDGDVPFEVVVVDDASTDGTAERLVRRADTVPYPLTVLRQERNCGPAAARNRGWRAARGKVVCFTDDDCIPQHDWVATLVRDAADGTVVQGRTIPCPDQHPRWGPLDSTIEALHESGFYETCNMAYPRELLERLDGFDEAFRYPYGEDTDLAWRARAAGAALFFDEEALVHHEVWPFQLKRFVADLRRREGMVALVRKHPRLRALLPSPWFQKKAHPWALALTVCGLVALARPRSLMRWIAAAVAACGYVHVCRATRRNPRRQRHWAGWMPLAVVVDLADVAALARASVRHRTLLL